MASAAAAAAAVIPSSAAPGAAAIPVEGAGWMVDERDGFISWLRGEFAAANAIIDLMLVHLRSVGEPGEFDHVAAAVQQRRHHWTPVIHMQQFFPVGDVAYALQQAGWRRRAAPQQGPGASPSPPPPPARRPSFSASHSQNRHGGGGGHHHHRSDSMRGGGNGNVATAGSDKDGREVHTKEEKGMKEAKNVAQTKNSQSESPVTDEGEKTPRFQTVAEGSSKAVPTPVEYTVNEIIDSKTVNAVEGLKVYVGLVNENEKSKILSLLNETKASCRRGGLEGQTVIIGKRPMKGHGRETIQLGIPIIEGLAEDDYQRETRVEAIPGLLHELFDRLYQKEIIPTKPDYCVIDYYNEGDYSHPHQLPSWYGRPFCTLCLTDCDMVFGRVISGERGDYRGPLKLSLSTGSLLLLQGKSADIAKRTIPAARKQRILLSFGKSLPRKHLPSETASRYTPPLTPPPVPWGPPSRPANMARHSPSPQHFGYAPTSGVLPVSTIGAHHISPSDGMQPLFVAPAPVAAAAIPFPSPVPLPNSTTAWMTEAAPRSAPPRLPVPGTGVFLPPGSGHPLPHQMMTGSQAHAEPPTATDSSAYVPSKSTVVVEMANGNVSPKSSPAKQPNSAEQKPECNGSLNGGPILVDEKLAVSKEQQNGEMKKAGSNKVQPNAA
uniref:Alpha-ketoglutarate-dependent dioxygenase AlkB-like domain-containing protein n=1 Tax=Leersia perrieri TaxID=77586 RepID=A0A0D9VRP9_9ORYZ